MPERSESRWGHRPVIFANAVAEFSFCFSIVLSQIMSEYFISGFFVTLPTLVKSLDIPETSSTWPANAFTLTIGASLLIFGRLSDMYGPSKVYLCGLAWYTTWSLICGFAVNEIMLDVARAFQGFGSAAFLTSGVGLLGQVYEPGKRKNVVFSIYGGTAPIGFFFGIVLGGATSQSLSWRWYFWIGTVLNAVALVGGLLSIPWNFDTRSSGPSDDSHHRACNADVVRSKPEMDVWGGAMFFVSLFLITFSITDSAHAPQGWRTPYIPTLFILGCLIFATCVIYEARYASQPLFPLRIFKIPQMPCFMFSQFLTFGTFGVWLFYTTVYIQNVLSVPPLHVVLWFLPFGLGGLIFSILGGIFLHRIPGSILLILCASAWVVATLLVSLAPDDPSYWPWFFPAMICGTIGIDVSYIVASVFLTSTLSREEQGLAGALFNSLQFLGISLLLGFADLTAAQYAERGLRGQYQASLYVGTGCAGAALILILLFLRVGRARDQSEVTERESGP